MKMESVQTLMQASFDGSALHDLPAWLADLDDAPAMREIGCLDSAAMLQVLSWTDGPDIAIEGL
jgi:hypothetical protein